MRALHEFSLYRNLFMKTLGIYIHIPFCVRKCDYCDFLSAPAGEKMMKSYVEALVKEIKLSKNKVAEYLVDTVFIGGGTPSILEENLICDVIGAIKNNCNMTDNIEMTIECNPGTVTKEKLLAYKEIGINRLSFGLQSADNIELKSIGRIHTYEDFLESYELAKKCGFDNISIDLMSALPEQNAETYRDTLEKIISLNPSHISAYSLIVEEGTKMHKRVENAKAQGEEILPDEDEERKMYYLTKDMLEDAGYSRYEISNYAKSGFECKHNIGYWKRKEYIGFGIGAASLYKDKRYSNISDINMYIDELSKENCRLKYIEENEQILSKQEQMEEFMFLGLRMTEGVSTKQFSEQFNDEYENIYGKISKKLIEKDLLIQENDNIKLTQRGIDVSNYVMSEFLF